MINVDDLPPHHPTNDELNQWWLTLTYGEQLELGARIDLLKAYKVQKEEKLR